MSEKVPVCAACNIAAVVARARRAEVTALARIVLDVTLGGIQAACLLGRTPGFRIATAAAIGARTLADPDRYKIRVARTSRRAVAIVDALKGARLARFA